METIEETKTYTYAELDAIRQEHIRNKYIESIDYEWWEGIYEVAKEEGYELGFVIDKMYFSGFYSQGDGASWVGQIDVLQWLRSHCNDSIGLEAWAQLIKEDFAEKHITVKQSGHYSHENTMSFGYWENMLEDSCDTEDDIVLLQRDSIFQHYHYRDLLSLIMHDENMPYKSTADIEEEIAQSSREYAQDIYKKLEEEWDWHCSEEAMLEHFDYNDTKFDEEGDRV